MGGMIGGGEGPAEEGDETDCGEEEDEEAPVWGSG